VRVWDAVTGQERIPSLRAHEDPITAAVFCPDGEILATASLGQTIKLWATSTGQQIDTLNGHENIVWGIAFSSDGKLPGERQ